MVFRPLFTLGILLAVGLGACQSSRRADGGPPAHALLAPGETLAARQAALERSMEPAALALARRVAAGSPSDLRGRAEGWPTLDMVATPDLGLGPLTADEAQRINAYLPASQARALPAQPFILKASAVERQRALLCLTQAIYYEAALEPTAGQEAVAQTILNRVRHPAFPKSICGVVYQGSQQVTGCQFSFTCDGSRQRPPIEPFWSRARAVAAQALAGFVMRDVGGATAYHADYVFPRWGPTLVKIGQVGTHIFYRFPGPAGQSGAYHERYAGGELKVSMEGPSPDALAAAKAAGLVPGGPQETYTLVDANSPGGSHARVAGQVLFGRRAPTKDEIDRINAVLAGMDQRAPGPTEPPRAPAPAPAWSDSLPTATTP